jgi:hypothetical protein
MELHGITDMATMPWFSFFFFFFFKERGNIDSYNLDQSMRSEAVFMLSKRENSNNLTSSQEFMYEVGGMAPAVVCLASTKP